MKYFFIVSKRYVLTFFCKLIANIASATHWDWTIPVLDFFLQTRGKTLKKEARLCMLKTNLWQNRAKKAVIAHHEFEKNIQKEKKCVSTSLEK